jgi:hypothetical protein
MLDAAFDGADTGGGVRQYRRKANATASLALGTLAYGARQVGEARRWLSRAVWADPTVVFQPRWASLWLKSLLGGRLLDWLRVTRHRLASSA